MRGNLRVIGLLIATLAGTGAVAGAQAATASTAPAVATPDPGAAAATYRGRKIDLKDGWGGARACAVLSPTDVRCYDSYSEANVVTATGSSGGASTQGTADCPAGWLCIYEGTNWDGRRLQFNDEFWHSLAPYGFQKMTSSWHNNQDCAWWQSKNDNGTLGNGSGGNLDLPACARSSSIGSYDNVATDIFG